MALSLSARQSARGNWHVGAYLDKARRHRRVTLCAAAQPIWLRAALNGVTYVKRNISCRMAG